MTSSARKQWFVPAALILLVAIPLGAVAYRLSQLIGGADITPSNARFFAAPIPIMVHLISVSIYAVLGAFQFVPGFRRRKPRWHRVAGRVSVLCGLGVGLSGLWMTFFYPLPEHDGEILFGLRVVFGSAMVLSIVLGFLAIRRRDIARHRAWMIRGYAIAVGAGTQALIHIPWFLIAGQPGEFARAMLLGAGWVINLAVAEWIIRRPTTSRRTSAGRRGPTNSIRFRSVEGRELPESDGNRRGDPVGDFS